MKTRHIIFSNRHTSADFASQGKLRQLIAGAAGVGVFDEDDADAVLVFLAAGIEVDDGAAEGEDARAVGVASGFDDDVDFGLEARAIVEAKIGALEAEVADGGFLFEFGAVFGLAADGGGEAKAASLAEARFAERDADAAFAEEDGHAFGRGPGGGKFLAGGGEEAVHNFVGGIGIMVEEDEIARFRFARDFHAFEPARVAPAFAFGGELLGGILGVVNEDVGAVGELAEIVVEFGDAGLVVGGVNDRADGRLNAEAEAALGMIEPGGADSRAVDFKLVAAGDFAEVARGGHGADVHGKVGAGELSLEDLAEAIGAKGLGLKTIEVEAVLRFKKRVEEGNALDVVPVVVGDEDVGLDAAAAEFFAPVVAEHAQAGAAIENEFGVVGGGQFEARRVAAEAPGIALERRSRAADSPKNQLGDILRHCWANRDARLLRPPKSPT